MHPGGICTSLPYPSYMDLAQSPSPTVTSTTTGSPTPIAPPPASGLEKSGAIVAIVLALAAAILGYRIIRGGKGL